MKKTLRIILIFYIAFFGLFMAYIFFDFIYGIIFLSYEFKFDYTEFFVLFISFIFIFSSVLSLIFNIRKIYFYNRNYQVDNQYSHNDELKPYKLNKLIWIGYISFSIATIVLAGHILINPNYLGGIISGIIVLIAFVILRDAYKNKITGYNKS